MKSNFHYSAQRGRMIIRYSEGLVDFKYLALSKVDETLSNIFQMKSSSKFYLDYFGSLWALTKNDHFWARRDSVVAPRIDVWRPLIQNLP